MLCSAKTKSVSVHASRMSFSSPPHSHFFFVFLCCVADPRGKYFFPCSWESRSKAGSGGWGRYRSKQMKRARPGQHAEATSTISKTACQSMVEQDAATQQTILRGHSLSLCKERHYYKPVRVWIVRIQKP